MQNYNRNPLAEGQKEEIIGQLQSLRENLQTPPSFGPSERKVIQTMNETRKPFVEKALTYGEKVPDILPRFVDVEELRMDLATFEDYYEIIREYDLLGKKLRDLMFAAGADSYYAALAIYNTAKMAARSGMSEAKPIVDDLKVLFENQGLSMEENEME